MKYIVYGAIIWGVAFIVASVFVGYKVISPLIMHGITTLAVAIVTFKLAKNLNIDNRKEMLKYSICWVIVGLILDAVITTRFTGWRFFYAKYIWIGYALILLVPLLAVKSKKA